MKQTLIIFGALFLFLGKVFSQYETDWHKTGIHKSIDKKHVQVINNYAKDFTVFYSKILAQQKNALQRLSSEVLTLSESLPPQKYKEFFVTLGLFNFTETMNNHRKEEVMSTPIANSVFELGIENYNLRTDNLLRIYQINSKSSLNYALLDLTENLDNLNSDILFAKIINLIADDYLTFKSKDAKILYAQKLETSMKLQNEAIISADDIYLKLIEILKR